MKIKNLKAMDIYKKVVAPILLIDSNIISFIGGIVISLSTNIFTSLCFEKVSFVNKWYLYISALLYCISSLLLMIIGTKVSYYQGAIKSWSSQYNQNSKKDLLENKLIFIVDATYKKSIYWVMILLITLVTLISATIFLSLNFFY